MTSITNNNRIFSIDLLRGIVMILMALDHVRDFLHNDAFIHDPLDLNTTTPLLFFTRWITHFCAPVFIFLAGISAYLAGLKRTRQQLSIFLLKRGLWLMVIEVTVVGLGWTFDLSYHIFVLQVIWAIGVSMFLLGLFVRLPYVIVFVVGILIVFAHNLMDVYQINGDRTMALLKDLFHGGAGAFYPITDSHSLLIIYCFLPWTGIMFCGYGFGKLFTQNEYPGKRKKILLYTGINLLIFFAALRMINGYGDPVGWLPQNDSIHNILAFINVSKYPPSLLYICLTLGPALILLSLFENMRSKIVHVIAVYGRVPFFYYIIHIYLIHIITVVVFYLSGYSADAIHTEGSPFLFRPPSLGFNLYIVYGIWLLVIVALYPLCKWYNHFKHKHSYWWLSYL